MEKEMSYNDTTQILISGIGEITGGCAYIKLTDNEQWPIEYVRLDDKVYYNQQKMGQRITEFSQNVQTAIGMAREYESFNDIEDHINPFIIKYHPTWILLRSAFGFTKPESDEILCERDDSKDTFHQYIQDNFLAIGLNIEYIYKANDMPLSKLLPLLFSKESIQKHTSQDEFNHPDFVAFKRACQIKCETDNETEAFGKGRGPLGLKGVKYRLGADGFPLILIGKKQYDFRIKQDYQKFNDRIHTPYKAKTSGKTYKKSH